MLQMLHRIILISTQGENDAQKRPCPPAHVYTMGTCNIVTRPKIVKK